MPLIALVTIRRSTGVHSAADFSVANRSLSCTGVSWVIIGTLVGGVSTIGTVQAAYTYGISAGIFTFGSGVSCFILGCFFAKALREEGVVTVSEYLGKFFGQRFRYYSSALNSTGMFIHVVGQFLASIAILSSVFGFADSLSVLISMVLSAAMSLYNGGGWQNIVNHLPENVNMLSFVDYGFKPAAIDMFSMLVGVLSTQIYLQAIFSAKNVREARNGAFLSAAVIPPIGVLGISGCISGHISRNWQITRPRRCPFFSTTLFPR